MSYYSLYPYKTLTGVLLHAVKRASTNCGGQLHYTANNGHIESHNTYQSGGNYLTDMDCTWVIEAPAGMKVELVAETFHLEQDSTLVFYAIWGHLCM